MKSSIIAAVAILSSSSLASAMPQAIQEADGPRCAVKVLHTEQLPYAPIGSWLASVTLQVIPDNGPPFVTTVRHNEIWQRSPPKPGEIFRLRCDPANGVLY